MEWLNLHTRILDSQEVIGSDPVERGTWLMLLRFCIGQENGGVIAECKNWKDRKWQQLVRVTQKEISTMSDLWAWSGENLVVTHYPIDKETEVQANRENGKRGGRPRKETEKKPPALIPVTESVNPSENSQETTRRQISETERKGIGKEGERNGREEKKITRGDVCSLDEALEFARACVMPPISTKCAADWHDHMLAIGWQIKNMPVCDWKAALRRYASKWNSYEQTNTTKTKETTPHKGIPEKIEVKRL